VGRRKKKVFLSNGWKCAGEKVPTPGKCQCGESYSSLRQVKPMPGDSTERTHPQAGHHTTRKGKRSSGKYAPRGGATAFAVTDSLGLFRLRTNAV
jgi:hypothetical protein